METMHEAFAQGAAVDVRTKRRTAPRYAQGSYRADRRNAAKAQKLVWRALRRDVLATGAVVVILPL